MTDMARPSSSGPTAQAILGRWNALRRWPGGRWLFAWFVGWMAPYTGTIGLRVEELRPGYARLSMRDRRKVRNPFRSIHAVAMMNLAEAASGLAMLSGLPAEARAIITGLEIDYEKKARGRLTAVATVDLPDTSERCEYVLESVITDSADDVVARARAKWMVGPRQ